MKGSQGFTLLEIIVIIAIFAILAGIAIPNYLAVQQRAWISGARFSLEHLRSCLEFYRGDFDKYPEDITVSGEQRGSPFTATGCLYLTLEDWDKILANLVNDTLTYQSLADGSSYLITAKAKDRNQTTLTATPGGIVP